MLVAARLRHVAATKWGTKRYLQMNRLAEVRAIASAALLLAPSGAKSKTPQPNNLPELQGRSKVRKKLHTTNMHFASGVRGGGLKCPNNSKESLGVAGGPCWPKQGKRLAQ